MLLAQHNSCNDICMPNCLGNQQKYNKVPILLRSPHLAIEINQTSLRRCVNDIQADGAVLVVAFRPLPYLML
jgi:hypothetical protein